MELKLKEKDILKAITDFLEIHKITYVRVHPVRLVSKNGVTFPGRIKDSQRGAPDLFIFPKGDLPRFLAVETKSPKGVQTAEQKSWQERLEICGGAYLIARSMGDVQFIERLLK